MIDGLARFLFDRQTAAYGADPALAELAWCDPAIHGFWLAEATAVAEHLGRSTRRRCADCRHSPTAHADGGRGACTIGCPCTGWLDSKRHDWRARVVDSWFTATQVWLLDRERVAIGYRTEMAEFEEAHPRPRLGDHMVACSYGDEEQVAS